MAGTSIPISREKNRSQLYGLSTNLTPFFTEFLWDIEQTQPPLRAVVLGMAFRIRCLKFCPELGENFISIR